MNADHLQKYLDKSGDERLFISNLVENKHGFASYYIDGEYLQVLNVYGDGDYWWKFLADVATEKGCTKMRASTMRNIDAIKRSRDIKVIGYIIEREVNNG